MEGKGMGNEIFIPNKHMIKGFEELQKEYLGEVMSSDQYKDFCMLNGKCGVYFSEPDPRDKWDVCDYVNIAAIDGNKNDISFGDLLVHHVRTDSDYKRFKMHIWYYQDSKDKAYPMHLDEQLVQAVEENYGVCNEDGMNAVETFIAAIAEGKLDKTDVDRIADRVDELEKEEIAESIERISSDLPYSKKEYWVRGLGECGKAAVPVLKSMLADIYPPKKPCASGEANATSEQWWLGDAVGEAFLSLIERGGGEVVVEAVPEMLDAMEAGWGWVSPLGKALPYIKDEKLKARAVSMLEYISKGNKRDEAVKLAKRYLKGADGSCTAEESACRDKEVWPVFFGLSLNLGGGYLNAETGGIGEFSYDVRFNFGFNVHNGNDDFYGLLLNIGLGGETYGDGKTLGSFIAGVTHFGYPSCHDEPCSGYRIGAGYKMAFDKKIEGNAVYGDFFYSLSWGFTGKYSGGNFDYYPIWLGVGPSVEYYPDSGEWVIGGKIAIGFDGTARR
jgi:hypothetical protein